MTIEGGEMKIGKHKMHMSEADLIIANLIKACDTLMDEVCQREATDWGIVNDAIVAANRHLKRMQGKEADDE